MPHHRRIARALCLAVALGPAAARAGDAAGGAPDGPAPAAAGLVTAMSESMRELDYEGTFVHVARGGPLSSMHILHANDGDGELERMSSLDGEAREIVRDHERVTCVWPASSTVVVTSAKPRRALPEIDASLATNPNYRIRRVGADRVAGRDVHVVHIDPVDELRYGYRFWIDVDTHMLLRSMLVDEADRALEEVLFTSIDYGGGIDPARFEIEPGSGHDVRVLSGTGDEPAGRPGEPVGDRVGFESLPAGYRRLGGTYRAMPFDGGPVSHVMISDGVASVSVYVEHVPRSDQDTGAAGASSIGGIHAWGASLDEGFVTVVGEVPPATVRAIAGAVRLVD